MTRTLNVFISSKMVELEEERKALYRLLPTLTSEADIMLSPWLYESEAESDDVSIRDVYLRALQNSDLYIGLFWNKWTQPEYEENWTVDEFNRAGEWGIERHIYKKEVDTSKRDQRLKAFLQELIKDIETGIAPAEYRDLDDLSKKVEHSVKTWLEDRARRPADQSAKLIHNLDELKLYRPLNLKLIGRDELLAETNILLDENSRVLLQGFAGMGKTVLAAEIAAQRIKSTKAPILWLKIGSASPDALFEAMARPFDESREVASKIGQKKTDFVHGLIRDSKARLVVLDDAWNASSLCAVLKAIPKYVAVLVTSRQRYGCNVLHPLEVDELRPTESLKLLLHYADRQTDNDASALCKILGHHPFSLEIAGATMKAKGWSGAQLLKCIEEAPQDLPTPLEYGKHGRSVKWLLDASVNALDSDVRELFFKFGAFFAPSATLELLSLYTGYEQSKLELYLSELQKFALARQISASSNSVAYFSIHALTYSYVYAQSGNEQRGRVLDACLAYMKQHEKLSEGDFAALLPMLRNFQGAGKWAFQDKERYAKGADLAQMLVVGTGSGGILDLLGFVNESKQLMEMAEKAAAEAKNSKDKRDWQGNMGIVKQQVGDVEQAIEDHEKALNKGLVRRFMDRFLRTSRTIHDRSDEAKTLSNLGMAHRSKGEFDQAIDCLKRALAIHEAINDLQGQADDLTNLGIIHSDLGRFNEAIDYLQQALVLHSTIPDRRGVGADLGNLGIAYKNLGQHDRAIDCYQQALAISREIKDRRAEGNHLGNLGNIYNELGKTKQAIDYLEQALVIRREIHDPHGEGADLQNLGLAYKNKREYERAKGYYEQSLAVRRKIHDPLGEGKTLGDLGNICYVLGQIDQALEYYRQARDIFVKTNVPDMVAQVDRMIARARAKR